MPRESKPHDSTPTVDHEDQDVHEAMKALFARVDRLEREVGALYVIAPASARALSVDAVRAAIAADPSVEFEVLVDYPIPEAGGVLKAGQLIAQRYYRNFTHWVAAGLLVGAPRSGSPAAAAAIAAQAGQRALAAAEKRRDAAAAELAVTQAKAKAAEDELRAAR